jgi:hypothetical protein
MAPRFIGGTVGKGCSWVFMVLSYGGMERGSSLTRCPLT